MGCFGCFDGGQKQQQRKEQERLASQEARAKAAEAAQKRYRFCLFLIQFGQFLCIYLAFLATLCCMIDIGIQDEVFRIWVLIFEVCFFRLNLAEFCKKLLYVNGLF